MFIETRGNDNQKPKKVEFSYAIQNPSASFGGLYTSEFLPHLDSNFFEKMKNENYKTLAFSILKLFKIDIDDEVLQEALNLYDKFDDEKTPAPLIKVKNDLFVNELYHGPTRAFKDMALQPFGYILSHLAKKEKKNYLILAATSGDTGPATLDTFANKENIKVACLYPDGGTSDVQRLQMVTESAKNLKVIGIKGDFDDAQNALKSLLANNDFKDTLKQNEINLSAANSVNFGRIIFQIIYHISSYIELLKQNEIKNGDKIYIIVPSGNFGNALGAYYAKKMGLPIEKILIASNINNILSELINTGIYDINNKKLLKTTSPAMDILISSNVERVLFDKFGDKRCKEFMDSLANDKKYSLTHYELKLLQEDFEAVFCDDVFALKTIKQFADNGYVMDPHTATCIKAYNELKKKNLPCVICSTAEWTKFAPTMLNAIENDDKKYSDKEALEKISNSLHVKIPDCINSLFSKEIVHSDIVEKCDIKQEIISFIKG
ncbi:MAG: threonine synthase [Campylobacteraceae bacterium]|jgi:threonine synthase|nr:threonine synthase [Campylobacteraceae bacterium]